MPAPRSQARQWSRTAWAVGLLFGSLPVAGRIVLGTWEFSGAAEIACLLLMLGAYFHIRSRLYAAKPDPATLLDQAGQLASDGRIERAIALLTRTIRQSPKLWQAYQYRGELRLRLGNVALAAQDFSEAIRLAPNEPHLYVLREQASTPNLQPSAIGGQPDEK
jgi:cytochrome c-type biogenesis protein CcmH/NrfG